MLGWGVLAIFCEERMLCLSSVRKLCSWELTRSTGMGTVTWESYLNEIYVKDETLGPPVDPSGLQG